MRGILLLGGRSSRMGQPKPWLDWEGRPLLLHMLEMMHTVCSDVVVVVRQAADAERVMGLGVPVYVDEYEGQGPLAGLHAGLRGIPEDGAVCLVGCDLPFLQGSVLADLHGQLMRDPQLQAVVPEDADGRLYPVCAVYRGDVRQTAASSLDRQENAMRRFLARIHAAYVPTERWQHLTPSPFLNMNTPEDYLEARGLHKKGRNG